MNYFAVTVLLCVTVAEISSYKTLSALHSIVFTDIPEPEDTVHSEYFFGKCATSSKTLIEHDHFEYEKVKGNIIIRGHLNITKDTMPNCIYIRAKSDQGDMVWYNAYKFTLCIITIVHTYASKVFHYYYYEWFVPVEMQKDIAWDLYFYQAEDKKS